MQRIGSLCRARQRDRHERSEYSPWWCQKLHTLSGVEFFVSPTEIENHATHRFARRAR